MKHKSPIRRRRSPIASILLASLPALTSPALAQIDFAKQVQPILMEHCVKCHGPQKQKGNLRLDSREAALGKSESDELAVVPGNAAKSELIRRVTTGDKADRMPPEGDRLSAAQIDILRKWIDAGAHWPADATVVAKPRSEMVVTDEDRKYWAYAPLSAITPPQVDASLAARTPIDRFLLVKLAEGGIRPAQFSRQIDPRRLIRRIHFDLIGLPPEPAEVEAFVRDFTWAKYEALVDRLLASDHFGERWGRHWLDVARYADSSGQEGDIDRPNAWRYRDFVIRAFNEDLPFDRFLQWQIAGDEMEPDNTMALAATGFLVAGPNTELADSFLEEERLRNRYNELDDMISTFGSAMLATSIACARCHDHKYDPIPARDYYRLMAALHTGDRADIPLASRSQIAAYNQAQSAWSKELKKAEGELGAWLAQNKGKVEGPLRSARIDALPIDDAQKKLLRDQPAGAEAKKLAKAHDKALAISEEAYRAAMSEAQRNEWSKLAATAQAVKKREPSPLPMALAFRDGAAKPAPTWLFKRGEFKDRSDPVELGFLSVLTRNRQPLDFWNDARNAPPLENSTQQRRALATWLTDTRAGAGHLAARAIVNRLWQHHFGEGLVRSVSDFGLQGEKPTHPQLLDWLAGDLIERGWKLKRLHRMMVTSQAYVQDTAYDTAKAAIDPDNRLLWRRAPQRLEAEILRDSMLAVAGTLNRAAYGPGFKPQVAPEAMVARNLKSPYPSNVKDGPEVRRRSVYMFHKRIVPFPLLAAFDTPDAQQSCGKRTATTVAPQALALLNDEFVRNHATLFAERLLKECGDDAALCVERGFNEALARPPAETERQAMVAFVESQLKQRAAREPRTTAAQHRKLALADFCQVLYGLNEFMYVD